MQLTTWQTIFVEGIFLCVGPACILINHYILNFLHFPYPLFLAGCGVAASAFFPWLLSKLGVIKIERIEGMSGANWYKRVMPLGFATAVSMGTGNAVYLYLNISFIQMLKSFTPVVLLVMAYATQLESPRRSIVCSVFMISVGTSISCISATEPSTFGILLMLCSQVAEALRLLITQYFLKQLQFGVIEGQYYLSPAAAFWLFFTSAIIEGPKMYHNGGFQILWDKQIYFVFASFTGIAVNIISYLVIKSSSSLTVTILGTVRNVLLVLVGVANYNDQISIKEAIGYAIAILGFIVYNYISKKNSGEGTVRSKGDDMLIDSMAVANSPLRSVFSIGSSDPSEVEEVQQAFLQEEQQQPLRRWS